MALFVEFAIEGGLLGERSAGIGFFVIMFAANASSPLRIRHASGAKVGLSQWNSLGSC
jgi:hypothetical protein